MRSKPTDPAPRLRAVSTRIVTLLIVMLFIVSPLAVASNGGGPDSETISGQVFDEHGMPKAGVLVKVDGTSLGTATDVDGAYLLTGDDLEGDGVLVFSADGYMTARVGYRLENGGHLERSVYLVDVEEAPGAVEGRVRSFDGILIQGALVTLIVDGSTERAVLSDVSGRFVMDEVPASDLPRTISAEAVGYTTASKEVHISPGMTVWAEMVLKPEIPMELIKGRVTDQRGLPLPGALVRVEGNQGSWTTGMDGAYSARVEGQQWHRAVSVALRGYRETATYISIPEPGVAWANFSLELVSGGGPETLWVQVLDGRTGEPVDGATVSIDGRERSWTTDSAGLAVVVANDMEGGGTATVGKASHTSASGAFDLQDGGTAAIKLTIVRASNAVGLSGIVVDGATGGRVPGAQVSVDASGILWITMTDGGGAFEVHNLPPGVETLVSAHASGYVREERTIVLGEYVANHVMLVLDPEGRGLFDLDGRIIDNDDQSPIADAAVTLWRDGLLEVLRTDARGEFRMADLDAAAGELSYLVEHRDYGSVSGTIPMPPEGPDVSLTVGMDALPASRTIVRGLVLDPDGFPVEGAAVSLAIGGSVWETRAVDGLYELFIGIEGDLKADLAATGMGYGWHRQTPLVLAHEVNWVNFTVPLDGGHSNVLGRVVSGGGRPIEGAEVQLALGGAYFKRTASGVDGAFAFRLVPSRADPYQLSAVIEGFNGATVEARAEPGHTTRYELTVREDITTLETLRGSVRSLEGMPLASAVVGVDGLDPVLTDANGTFVIISADLEGSKTVSASTPGFETSSLVIDMAPGGTATADLVLRVMDADSTYVSGRVVRASNGKGLPDATVGLSMMGSGVWTFRTVTEPDGSFTFHGVPRAWGTVTLTVSRDGFHADTASAHLAESEGTWVTFSLRRTVVEPREEPAMTVEQKRAVGAGVGAAIAALAAFAATEVGRVALLGLLLIPLYTKIKREKVMDHFVRGRIYEYICQNPGVNYSAIKKRFSLTNGTVTYHLSMLERQDFIRSKQDGIYKRYFQNGGGRAMTDVEPMSVQLTIAKAIREAPGMTQKEIAKRLGTSKQLVSYHIRRMVKDGQLDTRRDGRTIKVFPNHLTPE